MIFNTLIINALLFIDGYTNLMTGKMYLNTPSQGVNLNYKPH